MVRSRHRIRVTGIVETSSGVSSVSSSIVVTYSLLVNRSASWSRHAYLILQLSTCRIPPLLQIRADNECSEVVFLRCCSLHRTLG